MNDGTGMFLKVRQTPCDPALWERSFKTWETRRHGVGGLHAHGGRRRHEALARPIVSRLHMPIGSKVRASPAGGGAGGPTPPPLSPTWSENEDCTELRCPPHWTY
jgi:hypothetical protein